MPNKRAHERGLLLALTVMLAISGCTSFKAPLMPGSNTHTVPPFAPTCGKQADAVIGLLRYAQTLANEAPDQRESSVGEARQQVDADPSALHHARLAIALGTPAQHLYTPDEAARYAELALDDENASWSPATRQYLSDYARVYRALVTDDTDGKQQRIVQLQAQLSDARRKLHALAAIEKSLDSKTDSAADTP